MRTGHHEEVLELFTFTVGARRYAVDLARVEEVLPEQPLEPLPGARPPVVGCIRLRGECVPVVELRTCLGEAPGQEGSRPGLLVCWLGQRPVAFRMDGVGGVAKVALANLRAPGEAEAVPPGVVAVWAQPPAVYFLLDVLGLLRGKSPSARDTG